MALMVVAAYDVAHDGRRARLAALLQTCGDRIQLSVFLLRLSAEDLEDVRSRAMAIIRPEEDSLYLLRQCQDCWHDVECLGQASPPAQELFWLAL